MQINNARNEKNVATPVHCGEKMQYAGFIVKTGESFAVNRSATYKCPKCKHEEIITSTDVPEYDPNILKRGAEVIPRVYAHTVAEIRRLEASIAERKKRLQIPQSM